MKKDTNSKSKAKKTIAAGGVGAAAVGAAAAGVALKDAAESEAPAAQEAQQGDENIPMDVADVMAEVQGSGEEMVAMATEEQVIDLGGVVVTGHTPDDEQVVAMGEEVHVIEAPEAPSREEFFATAEPAPTVQEQPLVAEAAPVVEQAPIDDSIQILDDSAEVYELASVVETPMAPPEAVPDADFYDPDANVVSYMNDDDMDMAMGDAGSGLVDDVVSAIKDFGESVSDGISSLLSHGDGDGMTDNSMDSDSSDYINDANVDAFL